MTLIKIIKTIEWDIIEEIEENDLIDSKLEEYFLDLFYKKRIYNNLISDYRSQKNVQVIFSVFNRIDEAYNWLDSNDVIMALCDVFNCNFDSSVELTERDLFNHFQNEILND